VVSQALGRDEVPADAAVHHEQPAVLDLQTVHAAGRQRIQVFDADGVAVARRGGDGHKPR